MAPFRGPWPFPVCAALRWAEDVDVALRVPSLGIDGSIRVPDWRGRLLGLFDPLKQQAQRIVA